jgi:NTE family protein
VIPLHLMVAGQDTLQRQRPKVGLVLSGGGAKGFAYIGLLQSIQKAGLHIDYIGGTSMGAIVAGLYAVGYSPESMLRLVKEQDWDNLLLDKPERKFLAYEEKEYSENYVVTLDLKKKGIVMKSSVIEGQEINLLLNHYFNPAYRTTNFYHLPIPYLCIGTDILSGKAEVLTHGNLAMAVRSSMSIPVYFAPTYFNGKYLVDGGVINNFPVTEVKKMGAQIIIGGDVQYGLEDSIKNLNTIPKVMDQISSFYRQKANQIAYKNTDYYIHYKMNYGLMDFNQSDSIIALGQRVSQKHYPELKKLSDSLNAIQFIPLRKFDAKPIDSVYVNDIRIEGTEKVPVNFIINYFKSYKNHWMHIIQLEHTIRTLYGTRFFKHIFYELQPDGKNTILVIKIKEASLGEVSAALHYDTDYQGSLMLNLALRNSMGYGSKFFIKAIVGNNPRLKTLYLLDRGKKIGFGTTLDLYSFHFNKYTGSIKETAYQFINFSSAAFIHYGFQNNYNLRFGVEIKRFKFDRVYLPESIPNAVYDFATYGNVFFNFRADTYDKAYFPTRGFKTDLLFKHLAPFSPGWSQELFQNASILYLNYSHYHSISKKLVWHNSFFGGVTFGKRKTPLQGVFFLGGLNPANYSKNFVPFTGMHFIQEQGLNVWVARTHLRYNIIKKVYTSIQLDLGAIQNNFTDLFNPDRFLLGYGIRFSYNSFIGPVEITFMDSNRHTKPGVYFTLGHWF